MYLKIFVVIGMIFLIGCSKTTVVLLDNGKAHNAVNVATDKGSQDIDEVGMFIDLKDKEKAPEKPKKMSKEEIDKRFGDVLAAAPQKPISFRLYFKPHEMALTQESEEVFEKAIKAIGERQPCMVEVIGHTDTEGSNELNIKVSLKRAKYVEKLLKEKKLKILSLTAKGYGEEDLQVETADNVAEAKNRNVELYIR